MSRKFFQIEFSINVHIRCDRTNRQIKINEFLKQSPLMSLERLTLCLLFKQVSSLFFH